MSKLVIESPVVASLVVGKPLMLSNLRSTLAQLTGLYQWKQFRVRHAGEHKDFRCVSMNILLNECPKNNEQCKEDGVLQPSDRLHQGFAGIEANLI